MTAMTGVGAQLLKLRNLNATPQLLGTSTTVPRSLAVYGLQAINNTAATCFIQFFNVSLAASITLGTTIPDLEVQVGANGSAYPTMADIGAWFTLGCWVASTTLEGGSVASGAGVHLFAQAL